MFKIVSDQAKNVKRAFAETTECTNVIEITIALLKRQRKIDLIALQKEMRIEKELQKEKVIAIEYESERLNFNHVSPTKDQRKNLKRNDVELMLQCPSDDSITDSLSDSHTDSDVIVQTKLNATIDDTDYEFEMELDNEYDPYEEEVLGLDKELDEYSPRN